MTVSRVEERAHAKINLWLEVLGRRDDGFHELETIMHEVDLADRVTVERMSEGVSLAVDDPTLPIGEENLVLRAVRALEKEVGRPLPCHVTLEKHIPAGGGLGGGSSDGAAVLRALRRLYDLPLEDSDLERVAAEFGSDTSFFIQGGTAYCRGRGERIEHHAGPRAALDWVLIFPGFPIATASVFGALSLTESPREGYDILSILERRDVDSLRHRLFNRLEEPVRRLHPRIAQWLDAMAGRGLRVSGSGSTLFMLADDAAEAESLVKEIEERWGLTALATRSAPTRQRPSTE